MIDEKIRGCGRSGGAPRGNQNASKRPADSALDAIRAALTTGMTREAAARQLGVAISTLYRWVPKAAEYAQNKS